MAPATADTAPRSPFSLGNWARTNAQLLGILLSLTVLAVAAYWDLRTSVEEMHRDLDHRLTRVEASIEFHREWHHSGVGAGPAFDGPTESTPESEPTPALEESEGADTGPVVRPPPAQLPEAAPGAAPSGRVLRTRWWEVELPLSDDGEPLRPTAVEGMSDDEIREAWQRYADHTEDESVEFQPHDENVARAMSIWVLVWTAWAIPRATEALIEACTERDGSREACEDAMHPRGVEDICPLGHSLEECFGVGSPTSAERAVRSSGDEIPALDSLPRTR